MLEIPEAMRRKKRPVDPEFSPRERLFRRIQPKHLLPGGRIDINAVRLPDISVSREKHRGKPEYVLWGPRGGKVKYLSDWGIASIHVMNIPPALEYEGACFTFAPAHVPSKLNYYHSEIRCFDKNKTHLPKLNDKISKKAQMRWRRELRNRMNLL